jgi:hypothetical protein
MIPVSAKPRVTLWRMPEISRFLGIVISMYHREHGVPHFHAVYGEHKVSMEVESAVVDGKFPARALRHLLEWAALHRSELLTNWELAAQRKPLKRITPLE